ncbi:MAG: hypothetical protein LBI03_05025 [Clostridiales bacterium]|nr:hypothetical protein [Clostridiales bacterium]
MWAVGPFIMIGAGAVVWWLIVQSRVEFEYSLSGGILNIDEIINERKRQHLVDIPITKIIKFGKVSDDTFKAELTRNVKIMDCSSKDNENVENMYFLIAEYENKGLCLIIFEPNIKMIIRLQSLNPIALKKIGVVE